MKKKVLTILGILLVTLSFSSCNSTKKGCGLTSDANKIEQATQVKTVVIANAK